MNIDSIKNGIVLDHITAGKAMSIYKYLELDKLDCSVAIIMHAKSRRQGKKDIIKIDAPIDINLSVLGYIDPGVTVNFIKDSELVEKKHVEKPKRIVNVIKCRNPRCITVDEQEIDQIFDLTDPEKNIYRCHYCEAESKDSL